MTKIQTIPISDKKDGAKMTAYECKICGRTSSETKLTYNTVQGNFLCLDCYRNQFPSNPMYNRPIFL